MFQQRLKKVLRIFITTLVAIVAAIFMLNFYNYYTYYPQTRDGKIRADVVPLATDVAGIIDKVYVKDNQQVKAGQLLLSLDKSRFENAVDQANAAVEKARVQLVSANRENQRYQAIRNAVSAQDRDNRSDAFASAKANFDQALADQKLALINLHHADLYAPVSGIITNFSVRPGYYANDGQGILALVDSSSFYVSGYFEETKLQHVKDGDKVIIRVMGENSILTGHVEGLSAGVVDSDRSAEGTDMLANVNPTFSWIRLAQRIPVRIAIDTVPKGFALIAGRTVSVSMKETSSPGMHNIFNFFSF
ncbi:efflux RND transporter periplasmic adaptor subunit [Rouxiella sp. WC2420]|uniref:Efflux RND transporter periplasmic adaptor subunit n=1 Tax=Rouxiella sp. WC2420 TaxID=3234145 RepID=A0AB39VKA6_9GAMM